MCAIDIVITASRIVAVPSATTISGILKFGRIAELRAYAALNQSLVRARCVIPSLKCRHSRAGDDAAIRGLVSRFPGRNAVAPVYTSSHLASVRDLNCKSERRHPERLSLCV